MREINRPLTIMVFLGAMGLSEAASLNMQSGSESQVQVETESGVQALSENFLAAEAQSEAKMVA
jgi:hypothetical protein